MVLAMSDQLNLHPQLFPRNRVDRNFHYSNHDCVFWETTVFLKLSDFFQQLLQYITRPSSSTKDCMSERGNNALTCISCWITVYNGVHAFPSLDLFISLEFVYSTGSYTFLFSVENEHLGGLFCYFSPSFLPSFSRHMYITVIIDSL